jgi:hypothetical protein
MSVKMRQLVEKEIFRAVVDSLLKAGFALSIDNGDNNGNQYEIAHSVDADAIVKASYATDDECLYVESGSTQEDFKKILGWVYFVYGNDGPDVINDYTTNLEPYIGDGTEVQKIIDKYTD